MTHSDLAVIGAGPAGMAAAATAAGAGLSVTLLDEQPRAGGQIYRDVDRAAAKRAEILGHDFTEGAALTGALAQPGIAHVSGATVWAIEEGWRLLYTREGRAAEVSADRLILATGALERPMPLPGWTLPGVMTAGAGQILLKQSGLVPRDAVLVGCGPLLFLVAAQMVRAGVPPRALVETQTKAELIAAFRHARGALRNGPALAKGLGLIAEIAGAGIDRHTGATDIAIDGEGQAEAVRFRAGGRVHRIPARTVLLHHGVVPNTQAARSLGIAHRWDHGQHCFTPVLDGWGETERAGLFIAGDGAGIAGAKAAEAAGRLAALQIARQTGRLSRGQRDRQAAPLRAALSRERALRPFLDAAYPPYAPALRPADATIVCRCEEVTAGAIRRYAALGCTGPNQAKAFGRAGMGPCQGRYCGLTVTALLAEANRQSPEATGYYRIRPPLKPVTLGEIAAMDAPARDAAE